MAYSFNSKYFVAAFISSLICRLLNSAIFQSPNIHVLGFFTDFKLHHIMVREHHLRDISPVEFTEVAFVP